MTTHMEAMLRRLRKRLDPTNLWIDAVCLDQYNKVEVGEQVQIMGEIYSQAKQVLVWMGCEGDGDDEEVARVFAFFRTVAIFDERELTGLTILHMLAEIFHSSTTTAIDTFLQRPWFGRRWVLQELAMSRDAKIYCHDQKLPWKSLAVALQRIARLKATDQGDVIKLCDRSQSAVNVVNSLSEAPGAVIDNLWNFHACECSDPRDKLFSLIGFSQKEKTKHTRLSSPNIKGVCVDYSLSTESVFIAFADWCITEQQNFESILRHILNFGSLYHTKETLPSLCPDWSHPRREHPMLLPFQFEIIGIDSCFKSSINSILVENPVTMVYRCTETLASDCNWTDILYMVLPLLPTRGVNHGFMLAYTVCQGILRFLDIDTILGLPFTCILDAESGLCGCEVTGNKSIQHHFADLLTFTIANRGDSATKLYMSSDVHEFINGKMLSATLQAMIDHKFFSAPFRESSSSRYQRVDLERSAICFGFASSEIRAGVLSSYP